MKKPNLMRWAMIGVVGVLGIATYNYYSEPKVETQMECLEQGKFKHEDRCVEYKHIPEKDLPTVWGEVVDEIAESNNVSRTEAMKMILDKLDEFEVGE